MTRLLFILLLAAEVVHVPAYPLDWMLHWLGSSDPRVTGYNVYRQSGTNWVLLGTTKGTNMVIGQGCYFVTALATNNESAPGPILCTLDSISNVWISATIQLAPTKPQ